MATTIIDYLSQASKAMPNHIALVCGEQSLSYRDLDRLSERVALGLREKGVTKGARVAIYMDKSTSAIIAIYSLLKLGCCYVPISLDSPETRVATILKNCAIKHVLIADSLPAAKQAQLQKTGVMAISTEPLIANEETDKQGLLARVKISGDEPAAILHTSGSTGAPKGAVITQKNLAIFVSWAVSAFALQADDRLLSHAPLQFDLSFFDLFAAVAVGAGVVIATAADTANATRMAKLVNETGITIWQSVPSALTLQVLANKAQQPLLMDKVRCVLFAGERMPRSTLLGIADIFPKARFYNIYGCTETNDTFMYALPDDVSFAPDPLPLGQVLPHVRYRIVDANGVDVSPGTKGHLLVASDTIMAGYINLDETGGISYNNAQCLNGYYQTNDLVAVEGKGELYFYGRIDNVIKSNGYRINLMEIEDHLRQSRKFVEVAVVCEPDDLIGNRIIAVLKPKVDVSCSILELKIYCAKTFPKYAIPHRFHLTQEALPKGCTGKIDKQRLATMV